MKSSKRLKLAASLLLFTACTVGGIAQSSPSAEATNEDTNGPLEFLYGEWIGSAKGIGRDGQPFEIRQTERVGPMLGGDITVIEGRGYQTDGGLAFNAFAIVSKEKRTGKWEIRSYTGGNAGTFIFEPKENGFSWSIPMDKGAVQRFTTTIEGDTWTELGEYIPADGGPIRKTIEMKLKRIGATEWPRAGNVEPQKN